MTAVPRLSAAGMERLRQQLGPRDWAVLHDVARCRLMTGRQLQLLHFGDGETAARAARRLLARLTRHGLLARLDRQIGGLRAGSGRLRLRPWRRRPPPAASRRAAAPAA